MINTWRPRQNRRHFADDIFKCIFLNKNVWIPIKISLTFVPKGPIDNIPALFQIMAWPHICVTQPQWVETHYSCTLRWFVVMTYIDTGLTSPYCTIFASKLQIVWKIITGFTTIFLDLRNPRVKLLSMHGIKAATTTVQKTVHQKWSSSVCMDFVKNVCWLILSNMLSGYIKRQCMLWV